MLGRTNGIVLKIFYCTAERGPEKVERGRRWGRRKPSVVTDGTPEKGRRYSTFAHTERTSVATLT